MSQLLNISKAIFLEVSFEEIKRRLCNFEIRGIAKSTIQIFTELYDKRQSLYKKHAEITIDCNWSEQEEIALQISEILHDWNL